MAMLDNIVSMDGIMVSYYMSEIKMQSKQYIKKGQPGPIKAKVQASWTKQNTIGLLRQQRPLSTSTLCQGGHHLRQLLCQGLEKVPGASEEEEAGDDPAGLILPQGQCASAYCGQRKEVVANHSPQLLLLPPDLAPAGFFLFWRVNEELAGLNSLKKRWEGVIRTITTNRFATASQRWHANNVLGILQHACLSGSQ
jgi:hypothetical protein